MPRNSSHLVGGQTQEACRERAGSDPPRVREPTTCWCQDELHTRSSSRDPRISGYASETAGKVRAGSAQRSHITLRPEAATASWQPAALPEERAPSSRRRPSHRLRQRAQRLWQNGVSASDHTSASPGPDRPVQAPRAASTRRRLYGSPGCQTARALSTARHNGTLSATVYQCSCQYLAPGPSSFPTSLVPAPAAVPLQR